MGDERTLAAEGTSSGGDIYLCCGIMRGRGSNRMISAMGHARDEWLVAIWPAGS